MSSRRVVSSWVRAAFLCSVMLISASSVAAQAADEWAFSLGGFDIIDSDKAVEGGIELRFKPFRLWKLDFRPMAGVSMTGDGNIWGYGGLRYDLELGRHWIVAPSFSISAYEAWDGKDLGGVIEFRSGLEVSYRFAGGSSLGLLFYHLSNARLYELNPGSESLVLVYSFGR